MVHGKSLVKHMIAAADHCRERYRIFNASAPRFHRFVIGNPVVLRTMIDHDIVTPSLNAPWNFLVAENQSEDGRVAGTKVVFDLPSGSMASAVGGEGLNEQSRLLDENFRTIVSSWL